MMNRFLIFFSLNRNKIHSAKRDNYPVYPE